MGPEVNSFHTRFLTFLLTFSLGLVRNLDSALSRKIQTIQTQDGHSMTVV